MSISNFRNDIQEVIYQFSQFCITIDEEFNDLIPKISHVKNTVELLSFAHNHSHSNKKVQNSQNASRAFTPVDSGLQTPKKSSTLLAGKLLSIPGK
jgi:hypothetical protein